MVAILIAAALVVTYLTAAVRRGPAAALGATLQIFRDALVDLARMINTGERISLEMPYVNLISQRDAIERSLRGLELAANPPVVFNVSGPYYNVREICGKLAAVLGKEPIYATEEADTALIANDSYSVNTFGPYRDDWEDMIVAAANWVKAGGEYWNLPTKFGSADHVY